MQFQQTSKYLNIYQFIKINLRFPHFPFPFLHPFRPSKQIAFISGSLITQLSEKLNMNHDKKVVQKFQYDESKGYVEDGVQIFVATHLDTREIYLLKKVNLKGNAERAKQKNLINEVNNLKLISSSDISECHKMLKTSNNIYLVYDYCNGKSLEELLQDENFLCDDRREEVAQKIIEALKVMRGANIVHSNLNPKCIVVTKNRSIKIMNFVYSHNLESNESMPVKFKPPASKYIAPEISHGTGTVTRTSDIYSLGVIMGDLRLDLNSKLSDIITQILCNKPSERPSLETLSSLFTKVQRKKSDISVKRDKEMDKQKDKDKEVWTKTEKSIPTSPRVTPRSSFNGESNERSGSRSPMGSPDIQNRIEKTFVQLVLKRRNLAIFLLEMSEMCLGIEEDDKRVGLMVGFLLFKKSTCIITRLLGFLKNEKDCKNEIDSNMTPKQKENFEKKTDYFKLATTIHKESISQQRMLSELEKSIISELSPDMQQQARGQYVEDKTLLNYVQLYLKKIVETPEEVNQKTLSKMFLMSEIIPHCSYEKMFEELMDEIKINLHDQLIYSHVSGKDRKYLLSQISSRVRALV